MYEPHKTHFESPNNFKSKTTLEIPSYWHEAMRKWYLATEISPKMWLQKSVRIAHIHLRKRYNSINEKMSQAIGRHDDFVQSPRGPSVRTARPRRRRRRRSRRRAATVSSWAGSEAGSQQMLPDWGVRRRQGGDDKCCHCHRLNLVGSCRSLCHSEGGSEPARGRLPFRKRNSSIHFIHRGDLEGGFAFVRESRLPPTAARAHLPLPPPVGKRH
jgi:hypothetical protein